MDWMLIAGILTAIGTGLSAVVSISVILVMAGKKFARLQVHIESLDDKFARKVDFVELRMTADAHKNTLVRHEKIIRRAKKDIWDQIERSKNESDRKENPSR